MASLKQKVAQIIQREFVPGKVYRVDINRVDVQPAGSAGILRSLELIGDRDKLKPGDPVKIILVGGKRVALSMDVAVESAPEGGSTVVVSGTGNSEPGIGDMLKATYDQDNDGSVEQADNADTLDGLHSADFAAVSHTQAGSTVTLSTNNFTKNLGATEDTVQKALDKLDDLAISGGDWVSLPACTFVSSTAFSMTTNYYNKIMPGSKIRLTNAGSVKYFYAQSVVWNGVNLCQVNIIPNLDYTLVSGAISGAAYSNAATPEGWTPEFHYALTWTTANSPQPVLGSGTLIGRYEINGSIVTATIQLTAASSGTPTTFGTGSFIFSLPVTPRANSPLGLWFSPARVQDVSAGSFYSFMAQIHNGANDLRYFFQMMATGATATTLSATVPMAWAAGDNLYVTIQYWL